MKKSPGLHPRNRHTGKYDFKALVQACPELEDHVFVNQYGTETIDFFKPDSVKLLNKAILIKDYKLSFWDIPDNYLSPPIPGRADYIHHLADLLSSDRKDKNDAKPVRCLDIGVGANCIYPIIGVSEYSWFFTGSDTDIEALEAARIIVKSNKSLEGKIDLRFQQDMDSIFHGVVKVGEYYNACICNPPFHASAREAKEAATRKLRNLKAEKNPKMVLNFSGTAGELWCEGGEEGFIKRMINESREYRDSIGWFTSLVSKEKTLAAVYSHLRRNRISKVREVKMGQGNKLSRFIAWKF